MPIGSPVEGRTALTDQKVETTILTKIWPLNGEILIGVTRSKQVFQDQLAARAGTGVRLWFAIIGQSGKSAIPRKTHPSAARFFVFAGIKIGVVRPKLSGCSGASVIFVAVRGDHEWVSCVGVNPN